MGQFEIQTGFRRAERERESYMLLFERIRYCKSVIVCMPLLGTTACIFRWWPSMSSQYFHHNTDQSILTSGALYDKMRCLVPLARFNLSFPIWCLLLQIQFNGIFFPKSVIDRIVIFLLECIVVLQSIVQTICT